MQKDLEGSPVNFCMKTLSHEKYFLENDYSVQLVNWILYGVQRVNPLKSSGFYLYRLCFNVLELRILPSEGQHLCYKFILTYNGK